MPSGLGKDEFGRVEPLVMNGGVGEGAAGVVARPRRANFRNITPASRRLQSAHIRGLKPGHTS
jgi:hypothetical protein